MSSPSPKQIQLIQAKKKFLEMAEDFCREHFPNETLAKRVYSRCLISGNPLETMLDPEVQLTLPAMVTVAFALGQKLDVGFIPLTPEENRERLFLNFSETQRQVLDMAILGKRDKEIANELGLDCSYISRTINHLCKAFEVPARFWLAAFSYPGTPEPLRLDPWFIGALEQLIMLKSQQHVFTKLHKGPSEMRCYLKKVRLENGEQTIYGLYARYIALETAKGRKWDIPKEHPRYPRLAGSKA